MTDQERADLQGKVGRLTIPGARGFWNEIEEWLDAAIRISDINLHKAKTVDEMKEAQITERICKQLKKLPDNMVLAIRASLAEGSSSDITDEQKLNFIVRAEGRKTEAENG